MLAPSVQYNTRKCRFPVESPSEDNPLNLVRRDRIVGAVVELGRRGLSWAAMRWACSRLPPFVREAVIPVVRKLWQEMEAERPQALS